MVGVPVAAVDEQVELCGGERADRHADPFRTTTGERSSSLAGNVEHEVLGTERQLATGRRGAERELATGRRERWGGGWGSAVDDPLDAGQGDRQPGRTVAHLVDRFVDGLVRLIGIEEQLGSEEHKAELQ